jgi:hypothetical protein
MVDISHTRPLIPNTIKFDIVGADNQAIKGLVTELFELVKDGKQFNYFQT